MSSLQYDLKDDLDAALPGRLALIFAPHDIEDDDPPCVLGVSLGTAASYATESVCPVIDLNETEKKEVECWIEEAVGSDLGKTKNAGAGDDDDKGKKKKNPKKQKVDKKK